MPSSSFFPANGALLTRRSVLLGAAILGVGALAACGNEASRPFNNTDVTGAVPDFAFQMTRVDDGAEVTASDYLGKVTLLYFGYTFCPDICPTTLANVAEILGKLGKDATNVRFLFVTVDPNRDTPEVLKAYVDAFGDQVDGLRGTPDQLTELARRYRVSYSVTPKGDGFDVTHSSAIYVFDKKGKARLLVSSLGTAKPEIDGTVDDLRRLAGA
ncbi:MAG TPA: SCO family protein [Devosiaceae bacterium]